MNKLIRLYNQNRALIITIIIVIALIIIIIQILNSLVKQEKYSEEKNNSVNSSTNSQSTTISQSNVSVITGETVRDSKTDEEVIREFVKYCNEGEIEKAYNMLAEDCKSLIYPSLENFKVNYYNKIFYMERMYTLENWYSDVFCNTYYIKYIEDILATGNANSSKNTGDYITVIKTENKNYINISSFVRTENVEKSKNINGITIQINKIYIYMDYSILDINVKNNSKDTICIDTKKSVETTYLYDTNGIRYIALLNENSEEELQVRKNMEQKLKIKFNKMYSPKSRDLSRNYI